MYNSYIVTPIVKRKRIVLVSIIKMSIRIDFECMVGLVYLLNKKKGLTIDIIYYYRLLYVVKDIPNAKNSSFLVKLNIPIDKEKATMKSAELDAGNCSNQY